MKVLLIAVMPSDGTSWYRAFGPYSRLEGVEIIEGNLDMQWHELVGVDVAVIQRPPDQNFVAAIEGLKKLNIPVIVDYDDAIFDVEPHNNVYEFYQQDEKRASMVECLKQADAVTVSTQGLKENLLKYVPNIDVTVIPNAVDDNLFDINPSYHERNKIIVLRGGDSHKEDWLLVKDVLIQTLKRHPDYKLAVMGYHPEWLREIPNEQLMLFSFDHIPSYFDKLMELKPMIGIVPLVDSYFNSAKSNIAWQELTLAGAAVIASDLPEFRKRGVCTVNTNEELEEAIERLIADEGLVIDCYQTSLNHIPFLSEVNEKRKDLLERLKIQRKKKAPFKLIPKSATFKEFHDHELAYGSTQEYPMFDQLCERTAKYFISEFMPKSALELGCGTGGTLLHLLRNNVNAYGLELNPYSVKYFKDRYPVYQDRVMLADITTEPIELDKEGDLCYSIEVFEHINQPEEWWDEYLTSLSKKFKNFYFSSTPYYTRESFDIYWGHTNIRTNGSWVKLFEKNGWKYVKQPRIVTHWDLQFKSVNIS